MEMRGMMKGKGREKRGRRRVIGIYRPVMMIISRTVKI